MSDTPNAESYAPDNHGAPLGAQKQRLRWSFVDERGRMPVSPTGSGVGWTYDKAQAAREARMCGGVALIAFDAKGYETHREQLN
jgi:hypothetical protein